MRFLKLGLLGIVVFAFFGFLGMRLAYGSTDVGEAAKSYQNNLKRAQNAHLLTEKEQFLTLVEPSSSGNGAPLILKLLEATNGKLAPEELQDSKKQIKTEAVLAKYRALEQKLSLIDDAQKLPNFQFTRDYTYLPLTLFPEYKKLKELNRLLAFRASIAVDQNDSFTAAHCWNQGGYLAMAASKDRNLISVLVRISLEAMIKKDMARALTHYGQDPKWRDAVGFGLRQMVTPFELKAVLSAEYLLSKEELEWFMHKPQKVINLVQNSEQKPTKINENIVYIPNLYGAMLSRTLQTYAIGAEKLTEDPLDIPSILAATEALDKAKATPGLSYYIPSQILPEYTKAGQAIAYSYAQTNVLQQAIAMLESGNSKTLAMSGHWQTDADGKPLRIRKDADATIIYSVGRNRIDDKGAITKTPESTQTLDFGVKIPN